MDFGKFRCDGELSDVQVSVNGEEFRLHRFPLYTRSDFFLKEFAKHGPSNIVLNSFPGGRDTFTLVADFCYNINIKITAENVISLRRAAKFLEMNGSGNLYEKTGLFIEQCAADVKRGKNMSNLLTILSTIAEYGEDDQVSYSFDQCTAALSYHWNKQQYGAAGITEVCSPDILNSFYGMDVAFFIKVMLACKSKVKSDHIPNVLVSEYILHAISEDRKETGNKVDEEDGNHEKGSGSSENGFKIAEERILVVKQLIDSLKPDLSHAKYAAARWLKPLLNTYSKAEGSNETLGSIMASMANHMDEECVSTMSIDTMIHFAKEVSSGSLNVSCLNLLLDHMLVLSQGCHLTGDQLVELLRHLSFTDVPCHDNLLYAVDETLKNGQPLSDEVLSECLNCISTSKCTVKCLRDAFSAGRLPSQFIAQASLGLCEILQERLDATTKIVEDQEKEISSLSIQTFGLRAEGEVMTSPTHRHHKISSSARSLRSESTSLGMIDTSALTRVLKLDDDDHLLTQSLTSYDGQPKLRERLRKSRLSYQK